MSRQLWTAACVMGAAALAWWALATGGHPAPAITDESPEPAPPAQPAAPAPAPPQETTPAATARPSADEPPAAPSRERNLPERTGPIEELAQRYATEPRASASAQIESTIERRFHRPEVPAGLLASVQCRTSVCRIETRWSPERAQGFMSALMHMVTEPAADQQHFDPQLAISPRDSASDTHEIEVYVRLPAAAR